MEQKTIAAVSADPAVRLALARAFDEAPPSWQIELFDDPSAARGDAIVWGPDVPAGPGVVFDPANPKGLVGAVAELLGPAEGSVIVVTSPSGGTGTTTVALHLAQALAARGSTCFVDLDVRWGAAARLGVTDPAHLTWDSLDDSEGSTMLCALPVVGGFRAMLAPGGRGPRDARSLIERAAASFKAVVVDVADPALLSTALNAARAAVCVVVPTPTGVERASRFIDAAGDFRWAIVVNRLGTGGTMGRAEIEQHMQRRVAIELPHCPALRDNEDVSKLLASSVSRWSRAVTRLAAAL